MGGTGLVGIGGRDGWEDMREGRGESWRRDGRGGKGAYSLEFSNCARTAMVAVVVCVLGCVCKKEG